MPQPEESAVPASLDGQLYPLMVQASRAEVLASMSRELAHDLKGPIQALFLFDLNDREPEMESVFRMAVDKMAETIERVTRIYMPRPASRPPGPFTVADLVTCVRDMYEAQRSLPATELVLEVPPVLSPVLGIEWEWQHVLINLLMNAREAAGEALGARVTVAVRQPGSDSVEIAVRDTGPGVPRDRMDWIFQPLTTTKPTGGVHGLGLPVARWLARKNEGDLRVEPGDRSSGFVVTLPALPLQTGRSAQP
jgi:signal transduction histidine kinase